MIASNFVISDPSYKRSTGNKSFLERNYDKGKFGRDEPASGTNKAKARLVG